MDHHTDNMTSIIQMRLKTHLLIVHIAASQIIVVANVISMANAKLEEAEAIFKSKKILLLQVEALLDSKRDAVKKMDGKVQLAMGLFPKHVFQKMLAMDSLSLAFDKIGPTSPCPICSRLFIANAFMTFSCGCHYHLIYLRDMIFCNSIGGFLICFGCHKWVHGAWMVYWYFELDKSMEAKIE